MIVGTEGVVCGDAVGGIVETRKYSSTNINQDSGFYL